MDLHGISVLTGPDGKMYAINPAALYNYMPALPVMEDPYLNQRITRLHLGLAYSHVPRADEIVRIEAMVSELFDGEGQLILAAILAKEARATWFKRKRRSKTVQKAKARHARR